jgi:hypothetical protein
MRSSTAYFAGAGTVVVAVVTGLGGGLLFANMISPKAPKMEQTRLERRMSSEPIQVSNAPMEPVPYLAAPQPSAPGAAAVAPAQAQSQQAPPQTETANSASAPPVQAADTPAATQKVDASVATQKEVSTIPAPPAKPVARESTVAPEAAMAKVRDGDLKRVVEKRKAERRQQWTERRRRQPQERQLREVEEIVREETEPRRELVGDPVRIETPRIRLFGPD